MGGAVAGSVIGHGISNMLFGSSHPQTVAEPESLPAVSYQTNSCEVDQNALMRCLEQGDASKCQMYLEMLNQCKNSAQENQKWA